MDCRQAELFKVLGVVSRIRILELLKERGPLGAKEMAKALGITPSAVSQHLKVLRFAGLVRNERRGFWLPYEIDYAALARCGDLITEVCNCGCTGTCRARAQSAKPAQSEDTIEFLARRERELQEELQQVRAKIHEARGQSRNE
jgi:DNA-binding transcriptional ArsR family regulator